MREALIILVVIAVLVILTAIKYRRQIVTLIGFYRSFKEMKETFRARGGRPAMRDAQSQQGIELVRCSRCGKWILPSASITLAGNNICASECVAAK